MIMTQTTTRSQVSMCLHIYQYLRVQNHSFALQPAGFEFRQAVWLIVLSLSYKHSYYSHQEQLCFQWRPKSFWQMVSANQKQFGQPPQTNHTTVLRCRHCDDDVVVHSTNGHLVLITRLLSLSKIRPLVRAFYTMRFIGDAKGWLYI